MVEGLRINMSRKLLLRYIGLANGVIYFFIHILNRSSSQINLRVRDDVVGSSARFQPPYSSEGAGRFLPLRGDVGEDGGDGYRTGFLQAMDGWGEEGVFHTAERGDGLDVSITHKAKPCVDSEI